MSSVAYALREQYAGTVEQVLEADADGNPTKTVEVPAYTGGVVALGDRDLNVREELDSDPEGYVLVPDTDDRAIAVLDEYPPLKRVPVPAGVDEAVAYKRQRNAELEAELERRNVVAVRGETKAKLVEGLELIDARRAEEPGYVVPDGTSLDALLETKGGE